MVTRVNYGPKSKNTPNSCIWILDPLQDSILTAHQPPATIFATIALLSTHELIFQNWGIVSLVLCLAFVTSPTRCEFCVYYMFCGCDLWLVFIHF